jgi:tRNA-specific 2-thiouridylase
VRDARAVAERLDIPHYVLDYESRFRSAVIARFADAYAVGETPIPCVECNQRIKFTDLLTTARDLGADVLATGHYVASRATSTGRALLRPRDAERDQSYFMFATTKEQLEMLRFPLGDMTKVETRQAAERLGLPVADKPDSQDICFVPTGRYAEVIERLKPEAMRPGEIVHLDGRVLGRHAGIVHFTVGQRKGLGIAAGEPLYVVRLDADDARVVVGPREALATRTLVLRDVNWLGDAGLDKLPAGGLDIAVRVRSTRAPRPARLHCGGGAVRVDLMEAEDGVSPGQAAVFYADAGPQSRILGGGTICALAPAAVEPTLLASA